MANSGITVSKLLDFCLKQMARWNGDKIIFISSDDEWNDWHELFYWFTTDVKQNVDKRRMEDIQRYHKPDDIILLW